jgi:hypothetical protein
MAVAFAQEEFAGSMNDFEVIRIGSGSATRSLLSSMLLAFNDAYRTGMVQGSQVLRKSLLRAYGDNEDSVQLAEKLGKNLVVLSECWNKAEVITVDAQGEYIVVDYADGLYNLLGVRRGAKVQTLFDSNDFFVQMLIDA